MSAPKPGGFPSGPILAKEEIEKHTLIAKGQYGSVWKGRCRAMEVAVKVPLKQTMTQQNLLEFKKEVQIMR
jgi:predicted Ser/Thr protein kinase